MGEDKTLKRSLASDTVLNVRLGLKMVPVSMRILKMKMAFVYLQELCFMSMGRIAIGRDGESQNPPNSKYAYVVMDYRNANSLTRYCFTINVTRLLLFVDALLTILETKDSGFRY